MMRFNPELSVRFLAVTSVASSGSLLVSIVVVITYFVNIIILSPLGDAYKQCFLLNSGWCYYQNPNIIS